MSETSSRLLELLSLLQGRRDWPGNELADRLEVSSRTIRRDIERLRRLGYPVDSLTGAAGGYRLRAGRAMPPLLLDDAEAMAIAVGLRTAAGASVAGVRFIPPSHRRKMQPRTSSRASPRRQTDSRRSSPCTPQRKRSQAASRPTGVRSNR
jgi:predicted DNA-binding transcriptional regulator YafY